MKIEVKQNNIPECIDETALAIARAMNDIGLRARDYASDLTPVSPGGGHLRQSMTFVTRESPGDTLVVNGRGVATPSIATTNEEKCVYIGTNVFYAAYVEMGHRHPGWSYTGRHMVKNAIANHTDEWEEIFKREFGDVEVKFSKA